MPMGNGGDVYQFVKELGSVVPFVMTSTDPPENTLYSMVLESQFTKRFLKSLLKDKLISCLEKILK